ncbi:unnamed protein product [Miscanthus lutarioriparius]|uniref:FAD dependent oxidoreductase domain-containing protein n=1 Tax=Miscanthus lutarioriparius TaxID=422564 RepID=A0A811NM47_9POAL|nr:unnamed protein product [Miscanthus lutarioriparius]
MAVSNGEGGHDWFDVIVVGVGIMGNCAAYAASSRGAHVLFLEWFDLLHHRGSSHGESRTIYATYPQAHYPPMPVHTLICYWKVKPGHEEELTPETGFPTFASYGDPYIYGTPSMEFPGLIKIAMHGGPPCDPDGRDWSTGAAGAGGLVEPVVRWIDAVMPGHVDTAGGPVIRQCCMYSVTPDDDYVVDFLGGEFGKDVVVGAGFSGHGFKMGPAVWRILTEMAMDGEARTAAEAGVDLRPLRIGRFAENPKGNL